MINVDDASEKSIVKLFQTAEVLDIDSFDHEISELGYEMPVGKGAVEFNFLRFA